MEIRKCKRKGRFPADVVDRSGWKYLWMYEVKRKADFSVTRAVMCFVILKLDLNGFKENTGGDERPTERGVWKDAFSRRKDYGNNFITKDR